MNWSKALSLVTIMILGCSAPTRFARYTEVSRTAIYFDSDQSTIISATDSVEISMRYMTKGALDTSFMSLSPTGVGQTIYGIGPSEVKSGAFSGLEETKLGQRVKAMEKYLRQNVLLSQEDIKLLEPHLYKMDCAAFSNAEQKYDFAMSSSLTALPEKLQNPYDIQEYQTGTTVGAATTVTIGGIRETVYHNQSGMIQSGNMGLDVFEISISNNSSQKIYVEPKDIWLVDDAGNQQCMLDLEYFERLYMNAAGANQRPLRYANIERTILTSGPIFPGQTRKALIPFYPISTSAGSVKIYWSPSEAKKDMFTWTFYPKMDVERHRFLNVGIKVKKGANVFEDEKGVKNALIFVKPMNVFGTSGSGGSLSAYVDSDSLRDELTFYAVAAGDAKPVEQKLQVFFGSKTINLYEAKNKQGAEFIRISLESHVVSLP